MGAPEVIAGRYRVERAIGQGGMGTVWLCTDDVLGREVAVKQVGLMPGESAPDLARALREARSSAALHHPHVVAIFDAVEGEDDRLWLVMEYVPGTTLSALVKQEGRLEPRRVAAVGAQVAGGLAAAHARGTVHRDVKPGNILVDGASAKISDFGIARTEGDAQLTRSGLLIGTPLYFSPELARGAEPAAAADVWALGASLYAAVEGRLPVEDRGNPIATLAAIAAAEIPEPRHAGPLAPILARMLAPDLEARCTMAEAAADLARLADEHPTRTLETPAATLRAATPPTAAAPVPPAAADAAPPRTTGAPTDRTVGAAAASTSTRRDRRAVPWVVATVLLLLLVAVGGLVLVLQPGEEESTAGRETTSEPEQSSAGSGPASSSEGDETPEAVGEEPGSSVTTGTAGPSSGPGELVSDYYALLPGDPRAAWEYLGGEARADAGGYGGYSGFWATIESVTVQGTSVDEDGVVTVELLYDGSESETRRLLVEESDEGLLIADDLGPA